MQIRRCRALLVAALVPGLLLGCSDAGSDLVCGEGTEVAGGQCLPDGEAVCAPGTEYDPVAGRSGGGQTHRPHRASGREFVSHFFTL